MQYKIKEVAEISGVSVRMLHYYDKTGLLKPENVSRSGYRLYSEGDIERLSEILFYKELGFSLEEIKQVLNDSNSKKVEILKIQEKILEKEWDKIDALMRAVSRIISSLEKGEHPRNINMFTSFDMAEINRNKEKLKADLMTHLLTDKAEDCGAITSSYSNEDWTVVMSKADAILGEIYELSGGGPEDIKVQGLIAEFKDFINSNLIKCNSDTFKTLGDLYVNNPIYRNYLGQYGDAFPEFLREAILIHEGD